MAAYEELSIDPPKVIDVGDRLLQIADAIAGISSDISARVRHRLDEINIPLADSLLKSLVFGANDQLRVFNWMGETQLLQEMREAGYTLRQTGVAGQQMIDMLTRLTAGETDQRQIVRDFQQAQAKIMLAGGAQGVADLIFQKEYGTGKPIGITAIGSGILLVTIAGTEAGKWNQSNNALTAGEAGLHISDNAYRQEVEAAIQSYLKDHPTDPPPKIILAGHSLGGMVAEEMAADPRDTNLHISEVLTFGSPNVAPHNPNVQYQQYFDQNDPVVMLGDRNGHTGYFTNSLIFDTLTGNVPGIADTLSTMSYAPPAFKELYTGEQYVPDVGHMLDPIAAHLDYGNSTWLNGQQWTAPFDVNSIGPTQYFQ